MATDIEAGTYEVLRDRLAGQAAELARRASALNELRVEAFGSTGLSLTGTAPARTDGPCVARDLAAVGEWLLLGHEVPVGHAGEVRPGEVFTLYDRDLEPAPPGSVPGLLDDPAFVREFGALFRYYRQARLLRLRHVDGKLLAVFRTGETEADIRVLRWRIAGGSAEFLDAQGERDHLRPHAPDDVRWTRATREDQVPGRHPHLAVAGELYVSTVGGSLTVKTENDTETADGIHSEPVTDPLQALADAEVAHARVGPLILLRVRPYKEEQDRHLVFNTLTRDVVRLDGIGGGCRRLPGDQGIVFPGGYCLAGGAHKTFDIDTRGLGHERTVRSPNGEDVLHVFSGTGRTLLLPYNLIRKEAATPITCHGHALFDDGTLTVLRGADGATRVHPLQVWRSPYRTDAHAAAEASAGDGGPLARIGNADLVRGIADCLELAASVRDVTEPTTELHTALSAACGRAGDRYHWLGDPEVGDLLTPLTALRDTAEQVLAEFETVRELTLRAARALEEAAASAAGLIRRARGEAPRGAGAWVDQLTALRRARGRLLALAELRHADTAAIAAAADSVAAELDAAGRRAVGFLGREDAFADYGTEIAALVAEAARITTAAGAAPLAERLAARAEGLRTVTEVVTGLDIADATVRTGVLERVADVLGASNRARAVLDSRRRELVEAEGRSAFAAEFTLLGQAVTAGLAAAATPQGCEEELAGLLLRVEDLEARFGESEEFLARLETHRTEVYEAFTGRKQTLQDARARHAERLAASAGRILDTVARRLAALPDDDAVHTFLVSDPMVAKVRRTVEELRGLGDRVRAEELDGRLAAAREEAGRALRDRRDLYTDGGAVVRLGRHAFAVNARPPELGLVPQGDGLAFALSGTDLRSPVTDPAFAATRPYWNQSLPSENTDVYRAEYLAVRLLAEHGPDPRPEAELRALVRSAAEAAYDEGYERGVHDHDAALLLAALRRLHASAGLLRYPAPARAAAQLFWAYGTGEAARTAWTRRARSMARARRAFGNAPAIGEFLAELASGIEVFGGDGVSAEYLFEELAGDPEGFVVDPGVRALLDKFTAWEGSSGCREDLAALGEDLPARRRLAETWLAGFAAARGEPLGEGELAEAVAVELCGALPHRDPDADGATTATVTGLLGAHPRTEGGSLHLDLPELLTRVGAFAATVAPGHRAYRRRAAELVAAEHARLRLDEYRPRPLPGFVRGRLVDEVYLPLIGDNLARQLGTTGAERRTDSSGLLLLVSPPGYGKTTLMEYAADRLGLMLVKVSGPALGRNVTSLDPAQAPDATSRQEVEKINFALAAGSNVLLHLDDIQHTSPELLQKFISLCDATRRIEGVRDGVARTYDLRGKRFAVSMAANPYTETGARFRIPDMLASRADVRNLGDVLTGKEEAFAHSFVENALTSHPLLAPLAGRAGADLDVLVRLAAGDTGARPDRLLHPYAPAERERIVAVLRHLLTARDTVITVNRAYVDSATRADATRTEPPFRLQGSYRDMNKIAARIDPVMNAAELEALVDDHYRAEAQTLTGAAEGNLLKLAELRGVLTAEQAERWNEVKAAYVRSLTPGGPGAEQLAARAVGALGLLAERLAALETAIRGRGRGLGG
ncbi:DNA repair ATPase [Streptomyces sp. Isolate_45]|uniref:DNA repair ATPase n=1 Tax=Streptomyces sp. Isolate_45 TaxID=2950111 RepID=UPI002481FEA1|nr:DNA repair ATPase [Streptomyces sp. Isolate_45]MDA5284909.1 DNA repair ATPase [Streptomyces sp. Isolate_45]